MELCSFLCDDKIVHMLDLGTTEVEASLEYDLIAKELK
jgi:hypothetical protein